jgi:hypothetical protein
MKLRGIALFVVALIAGSTCLNAESYPDAVILQETGFPSSDSSVPSASMLSAVLPGAQTVSAAELPAAISKADCTLMVLPYGSAFPEDSWPQILAYLNRGGNLLVLGGRPFTRAAYRDSSGWHLRDYSVRFIRELGIDNYTTVPGSEGLQFQLNSELVARLQPFAWSHAFSPIVHLSYEQTNDGIGAAGYLSARLDAFAWSVRDESQISAPAIQIDHLRERFQGGRWVFLNAELPSSFFESDRATQVLSTLAGSARRGAEEFIVRPSLPLYLPGESVPLEVSWLGKAATDAKLTVEIKVASETDPSQASTTNIDLPKDGTAMLFAVKTRGFHVIEARLMEGSKLRAIYHSGFWIHDEDYLRSGPRLTANQDYLLVDDKPLAVVGTTYMASDVQRMYFEYPNAYVWDRDMAQISSAGVNMLRTGWWTGWKHFMDENGVPSEGALRTLEAFLMTARKYNLPVQFNLFAFIPDVLDGENSYLDPVAVGRQQTLVAGLARRFHDVPFLAWDLINEPSFSKNLWTPRPNGDAIELAAWNGWLRQRHPDFKVLAHDWNTPQLPPAESVPLPTTGDFSAADIGTDPGTVKLYDFYEFAQETFSNWTGEMRTAIRSAGSTQLITVGQDEGGEADRLSPVFYAAHLDFTTNHSWWHNDSLLWDSLAAKQPGLPMLIQETGIMRQLNMDLVARRSPESTAALLERKFALSLVQGTGAIQWLWNTNDHMISGNEVQIGILRSDRTEKPEGQVMRGFARFSQAASASLLNPQRPDVAIVTSQAEQFSSMQVLEIEAQRNAVIAASYYDRIPVEMIAENQLPKLGNPKLAILPSAQALSSQSWELLLNYVRAGGNLLVTGSVDRDEYFHRVSRAAELFPGAQTKPLTARENTLSIGGAMIDATYSGIPATWMEALQWKDGTNEVKQAAYGRGKVFWAAYPVEAARNLDAAAGVYRGVFAELNIEPGFELLAKLSPGVLIYPTQLEDSVLYVMVSDSADDADIALRDKATGATLKLHLLSERAAVALIRKPDGKVIAEYGLDSTADLR